MSKQTSKNTILDAALKLFSEQGYDGVSVSQIVSAAGITKPTMYYFFSSKEGLFKALWEEYLPALLQPLKKAAVYQARQDEYERDVFPVLCAVAEVYMHFAKTAPEFFQLLLTMNYAPPTAEGTLIAAEYNRQIFDVLHTMFLDMGKAHGGINGREVQLTLSFLGTLNSFISCHYADGLKKEQYTSEKIVHQFMHGIFS